MKLNFKVNNEVFSSENPIISGADVLRIAGLKPEDGIELYKKVNGNELIAVNYEEMIDLKEPGTETFITEVRKQIKFEVDDERYFSDKMELTPLEIFTIIGLDHTKYYLKQINGHLDISYKSDENKSIDMRQNPKFITCKREPATVS
jgi:hypothetical protein